MYFVFGNYGDNTLAAIQWAYNNKLTNVTVLNIDTGWYALGWQDRVLKGQELAKRYKFEPITLKPKLDFADYIRDRKQFPTAKYQWCATFLKALPLLNFLDEVDAGCESIILFGASRTDSRARYQLPEFINESEHYGGRNLWYPLYNKNKKEKDELILQTGFNVLNHRSLECHPCIHSTLPELNLINSNIIAEISILEQEAGETFFPNQSFKSVLSEYRKSTENKKKYLETIDMGCGSRYACGE